MCKYGLDTHFDCHLSNSNDSPCQICHKSFQSSKEVYVHYLSSHIDITKLDGEHQLSSGNKSDKNDRKNSLVDDGDTPAGFAELGMLSDFSSGQFSKIAKVWCEKNQRQPSSESHNYYCHKCKHAFPCAEALMSHLKNHPDECNVTCGVCDVTFNNRQQFEDHVLMHVTEKVVKDFSQKIGTDDNDVQDMVSKPEFMLVLGLKATKNFESKQIMAEVMKAISERSAPPVSGNVRDVKSLMVKPVEPELKTKEHTAQITAKGHRSAFTGVGAFQKSSVSEKLKGRNQVKQRPMKNMNKVRNNGEIVEVDSSSEDDIDMGKTAARPWQCVICEFAFTSSNQCVKHCRYFVLNRFLGN